MKPIVAVTGPSRRGRLAWRMTAHAVRRAGGRPRRVSPARPLAGRADALIIGGGADVAPALYHRDGPADTDPGRDRLELSLLAAAADADWPTLGICRGGQLMNVYAGGTLQPAPYAEPQRWTVRPHRRISVAPGSRLASALGRDRCAVNSMHRHAIDDVGEPLEISARDDSGVVHAVEDPDRRFWIGLQWHPEYLPQRAEQRRLFAELVEAARARKEQP